MNRLTKEEWLDHGLQTLAADGFTALKADKLVKTLGVSRGSFYWHFKNLADFHAAVLQRWQEVSVAQIIEQQKSSDAAPSHKLTQLINLAMRKEGLALSQAIRAWAFNNSIVKQSVDSVDAQCIGYLQHLLQEMGLNKEKALIRGRLIYCSYLGQVMLGQEMDEVNQERLVKELIQMAKE